MQRRDRGIVQSLGAQLTKKVKESRVLLVGAGGIGCELLKNLVCSGFGSHTPPGGRKAEIVVIDLDTIDLSNLNRQFLFRHHHIKKPKAIVAKGTAGQFNPSVHIDAHHASIFDSQYDVEFFEGFDVVFNALDNLAARRHVNRMCLAANVPLIESGTTGFNGQVQAIQKGATECYDCNPKPEQKSFPICTIRSTPSQPIHCIVWAKSYLLPELFGTSEEEGTDMAVTDEDDAEEVAKLKEEAAALKKIRSLMGTPQFATEVFKKVFHDDIERLRSMEEMWQSRKAPTPLSPPAVDSGAVVEGRKAAAKDQETWTMLQNISVFCYSIDVLSKRVQGGESPIEFDKDDKDTLDFVASAANLRSHIFDIPMHSEWDIKQMAGNIIPAIATSNALTASLCVMEAFKIMRNQQNKDTALVEPTTNNNLPTKIHSSTGHSNELLGGAKMVFLTSKNTYRLITSQPLSAPNPDCPVCSSYYAKLVLPDEGNPTLQELVDLLKKGIGYEEFSMTLGTEIIYDPDMEEKLPMTLAEIGMTRNSNIFFTVTDMSDEERIDLVLNTQTRGSAVVGAEHSGGLRLLPESPELPLKQKPAKAAAETNGDTVDGVVRIDMAVGKRKREAEDDVEEAGPKKARKSEVVTVEDDGAILLDD